MATNFLKFTSLLGLVFTVSISAQARWSEGIMATDEIKCVAADGEKLHILMERYLGSVFKVLQIGDQFYGTSGYSPNGVVIDKATLNIVNDNPKMYTGYSRNSNPMPEDYGGAIDEAYYDKFPSVWEDGSLLEGHVVCDSLLDSARIKEEFGLRILSCDKEFSPFSAGSVVPSLAWKTEINLVISHGKSGKLKPAKCTMERFPEKEIGFFKKLHLEHLMETFMSNAKAKGHYN